MTEDLKEQLLELYSKNLLDTEIAKIIGRCPDTIARYRKKLNLINNKIKNLQNVESDVVEASLNNETVYSIE